MQLLNIIYLYLVLALRWIRLKHLPPLFLYQIIPKMPLEAPRDPWLIWGIGVLAEGTKYGKGEKPRTRGAGGLWPGKYEDGVGKDGRSGWVIAGTPPPAREEAFRRGKAAGGLPDWTVEQAFGGGAR